MVDSTFYCIAFDGMFMIEVFWISTYPSKVLQLICDCLPFKWPFHPNLGLSFLTPLMIFFSWGECHKMFIRSRIILQRIFKSLSFCLIGFWRPWLFNYPLTSTLNFPILFSMDWHGTKGVISLNVPWAYLSNCSSIRWDNPKLLVRQCRVPKLGINGGEGKWPKMFPNVLNQLISDYWVSLHLYSSI